MKELQQFLAKTLPAAFAAVGFTYENVSRQVVECPAPLGWQAVIDNHFYVGREAGGWRLHVVVPGGGQDSALAEGALRPIMPVEPIYPSAEALAASIVAQVALSHIFHAQTPAGQAGERLLAPGSVPVASAGSERRGLIELRPRSARLVLPGTKGQAGSSTSLPYPTPSEECVQVLAMVQGVVESLEKTGRSFGVQEFSTKLCVREEEKS